MWGDSSYPFSECLIDAPDVLLKLIFAGSDMAKGDIDQWMKEIIGSLSILTTEDNG